MCIGVSAQVISIDGDNARVSVRGNETTVSIGLISPKIGDYVLLHAGCALQILPPHEAQSIDELFDELQQVMNNEA